MALEQIKSVLQQGKQLEISIGKINIFMACREREVMNKCVGVVQLFQFPPAAIVNLNDRINCP